MDELITAVARLLQGRTKFELELARGVFYSAVFPRRHPEIPLIMGDLTTEQIERRRFAEVKLYAPVPIIIGSWGD